MFKYIGAHLREETFSFPEHPKFLKSIHKKWKKYRFLCKIPQKKVSLFCSNLGLHTVNYRGYRSLYTIEQSKSFKLTVEFSRNSPMSQDLRIVRSPHYFSEKIKYFCVWLFILHFLRSDLHKNSCVGKPCVSTLQNCMNFWKRLMELGVILILFFARDETSVLVFSGKLL